MVMRMKDNKVIHMQHGEQHGPRYKAAGQQ